MATAEKQVGTKNQENTDSQPTGVTVAAKVDIATWRRLKYLSLKLSMSEGHNVTISRAVGDILNRVSADLPEPPDDLMAA